MKDTIALRQLLRSLCHNTQWDYAVFWKLNQGSEIILSWEDSYFDDTKARVILEDTLYDGSLHINPGMISFADSKDAQHQSCATHPIKVALANLKYHHYSLGEGFVGKVALTQGHYWIFACELKSKVQSDSCKDWQLLLAADIKTILLVPVAHYGVVQLGSLEMVVEDLALVFHIKDSFSTLYHHLAARDSGTSDLSVHCPSISSPINKPLLANSSTSILSSFSSAQSQQLLTIDPNVLSFFMVNHNSPTPQNVMEKKLDIHAIDADKNLTKERSNYLWFASTEEPQCFGHPNNLSEGNMSDFSFNESETKITFQPDPLDCKSISGQKHHGYTTSVEDITYKESDKNYISRFPSFPIESELHKVLGMASVEEYDGCFLNTTLPVDDGHGPISSITNFQTVGSEYYDRTFNELGSWLIEENDTEYLLDTMVSSLLCDSNDDAFEGKSLRSFRNNSSEKLIESSVRESESSVLHMGSLLTTTHPRSTSISKDEEYMNSPTISSCISICGSTNGDNNNRMAKGHNSRKLSMINKRGGRKGNSHKPRPRDRQLIQDRVKELRELIPNGSKCSIDTLLDRTVSHMLFLQSISSQAEKLKQTAHTKVKTEVDNSVKPHTQANGANSTCEQGSQPEVWPIVVEYLDQPGQILVEVLCSDYGLFLEIAHVIRRLQLTILKGILESRSDKLWAHFIIEVSRGFHRMHILWPLMQLLQRNRASKPTKF